MYKRQGQATDLVSIFSKIIDASDGTEDASLLINSIVAGSQVSRLNITPTEIAINDDSISSDFRVEGATDANNLIVDASGDRVGIGVAAPASKLEISAGVNSHGLLRLDDTDAGNLGGYMQFDSNGTNKANIQNANNAGIHINVGTGGSIVFTQTGYTAANALNDYEEGTFTPTLTSSSGASRSIDGQVSRYTKIGDICYVSCFLTTIGALSGSNSGTVRIGGLPFNYNGGVSKSVSSNVSFVNVNLPSGIVQTAMLQNSSGTSNLWFFSSTFDNTSLGELGISAVGTTSTIGFSLWYEVA